MKNKLSISITKGHLSNKDRIIWQQVLSMPLILPLTKGHPSIENRIIWRGEGNLIRGGLLDPSGPLLQCKTQGGKALAKKNEVAYNDKN